VEDGCKAPQNSRTHCAHFSTSVGVAHTQGRETVFDIAVRKRGGVAVCTAHCAAELVFDEAEGRLEQ
jgi:hypothetical protein